MTTMALRATEMGKKVGRPGDGSNKTSVKLPTDLHRDVRTLAGYHGVDLIDYLARVLRPIIAQQMQEMAEEVRRREQQQQQGEQSPPPSPEEPSAAPSPKKKKGGA